MRLRVRNVTRDRILADRARRASSFVQRLVGLMGRAALPPGEALLLEPCSAIHTCFMRLPIDAAFLDADGVILRQVAALPPWRATLPCRGARAVLELPAGTLGASGTYEGDRLHLERVD